jgi:ankyrin repeat protein
MTTERDRYTPLTWSVKWGNLEEVRQTFAKDPGLLNTHDNDALLPLWYAVKANKPDIVHFLLEAKASPEMEIKRRVYYSISPMSAAIERDQQTFVLLFLQHGVSANHRQSSHQSSAKYHHFLHIAAMHRSIHCIHTLLQYGANPNLTNYENFTPMDLACRYDNYQEAALLMSHGTRVTGYTMEYAIRRGRGDMCQSIVERNRSLLHWTRSGPPLVLAVTHRQYHVTHILLQMKASVNAQEPEMGYTAPMQAAMLGDKLILDLLLGYPCDLFLLSKQRYRLIDMYPSEWFHDGTRLVMRMLKVKSFDVPMKYMRVVKVANRKRWLERHAYISLLSGTQLVPGDNNVTCRYLFDEWMAREICCFLA